jgi:hypothetical protein
MNTYSFDFEWLDDVYYVDAEVIEDGLFTGDDEEFLPVEQPIFGITITDCCGEELEYADDILVDIATQILNNLYWFEIQMEET